MNRAIKVLKAVEKFLIGIGLPLTMLGALASSGEERWVLFATAGIIAVWDLTMAVRGEE